MTNKKPDRMYHLSREQKNPQVGCEFGCIYCAFRKLTQRLSSCPDCKAFRPHYHMERLKKNPKKTVGKEFISLCLNGDVSFASAEFIQNLIRYCEQWHDRTFLIQSKNPARFLCFEFPYNVILGTTIETNYKAIGKDNVLYFSISKAPHPEERYRAMRQIQNNDVHPNSIVRAYMLFCPIRFSVLSAFLSYPLFCPILSAQSSTLPSLSLARLHRTGRCPEGWLLS